ncbi:hypothetical protein D9Q98_000855 [Chlorella vulgaris]|uniref:CCR4-NOT transcription complex subunit 3 n=1 Tax=Chlorella vulgaris TaxID=3077 RepID=A0A9D4TYU0_CHLVU|nr:hypothetical protein D9Q98_000855 [Chlorella vulgaris]
MSKVRKLVAEIDATLKRIHEGVHEWDTLWDKLEETEVRGWAASNEIKDAAIGPRLLDARHEVEREMERFKQLEKELKIKQFSSEGLKRDSTDPLMVAKCKCADWLSDAVAQLETQVEQFEADLEAEGPAQKGRAQQEHRLAELEVCMKRHLDHITRLEQCLRLLENDQVGPEEVEGALRDGIEYYLQSSTEPDFMPDDHLYDSLPLRDIDDSIGKIAPHSGRPPQAKGKAEGGEGEGADAAPDSGAKGKRGKGGKAGGKGKGDAGAKGEAGKGGAKPTLAPPPGLAPPPPPPAAAGTPTAASRGISFRQAAAAGALSQAGSPTKGGASDGPQTPARAAQPGAASATPATPKPGGELLKAAYTAGAAAGAGAGPVRGASPPAQSPRAGVSAAQGEAEGAAGGSAADSGVRELQVAQGGVPLALPPSPTHQLPTQQQQQQQQVLSPISTARLGAFNQQMMMAAAAHEAEQRHTQQQAQQLLGQGVPAGLPPPPLSPAPPITGHSPFAALASGISAATGGHSVAEAARPSAGPGSSQPSGTSQAPAPAAADTSPHSVRSGAGGGEADGQPAAGSGAAASAGATPAPSTSPVPAALSFSHLQPQGGSAGGLADAAGGGGTTLPANGVEGTAALAECRVPWCPTLADLQCLEASVGGRPQPGDADWRLTDGTLSGGGGPPAPQHPVVTPPSFPNMVHPSLRREETWKKLNAETAFFNFYFQQGTRQQLFGANALKTQGWRYHTQFNAWFARQSQPRTVTDAHEIGSLVYFDAHLHNVTPTGGLLVQPQYSGWCPRVSRPDFLFEYKHMESEATSAPSDAGL